MTLKIKPINGPNCSLILNSLNEINYDFIISKDKDNIFIIKDKTTKEEIFDIIKFLCKEEFKVNLDQNSFKYKNTCIINVDY